MSNLNSVIRQIKPCDDTMPYVFISYSSADKEIVWRDVLEFQKRGYNVWLDEKNLDKTKASWKEDALTAIEDMDCALLVFYVSKTSLRSDACFQELAKTVADSTKALHFGPVKFIAVDAEDVGDMRVFHQEVFESIRASDLDKEERRKQAMALNGFMQRFFNSNNEKVRIHPKDEKNRKMDYYEEILAAFPDDTRIFVPAAREAEPVAPVALQEIKPVVVPQEIKPAMPPQEVKPAAVPQEAKPIVQQEAVQQEPIQQEAAGSGEKTDFVSLPEKQSMGAAAPAESTAESAVSVETLTEADSQVLGAMQTEEASEAEDVQEEAETGVADYFTHYEEPPASISQGRLSFKKKDLSGAKRGNGIYQIEFGYKRIEPKFTGTLFGGKIDLVQMDLPDSLQELNPGEFKNCERLQTIRLPRYIRGIGIETFRGCCSLKYVEVPGNVTSVGFYAFAGCSSLEGVKLPEGLKTLDNYVFEACGQLKEMHLPQGLEAIGRGCFKGCAALKEIVIPGGVKKLPAFLFSGCYGLRKVVLEEGVTELENLFSEQQMEMDVWIPDSVVKIDALAFRPGSKVTIHCNPGSAAHEYAKGTDFPCVFDTP